MLDVKRIKVLREVIDRGSFSAAGDGLHLSQSAVSQQVAALEREVGLPLLDRTSSGPRLTEAGEALMGHADAVFARLEEAERELAEIAGLKRGRVRLVSFPTASATLVTRAVSRFRRSHPGVELHLAEREPEDAIPALRRGEYDLALYFDFADMPDELGRDLQRALILEERMWIALPGGHPLTSKAAIAIKELAGEDWLCGETADSCRAHVFHLCRSAGFEPRISFESDDYAVMQGLVAAGLGVTLLPDLALANPNPEVELRPIAGRKAPVRRVWSVTREPSCRSAAVGEMQESIVAAGREFAAEIVRAAA